MIAREAQNLVLRLAKGFPVIAITGPRQSGKTTLAKSVFPEKPYLSLEDPDVRLIAEKDPRGLITSYPDGAILDEIQRVPSLFSYIQTHVDQYKQPGMFILTGSQQFGLLSGISQTLAGRVGLVQLLPFSFNELQNVGWFMDDVDVMILKGGYPPLYDMDILPVDWFSGYSATYIERDVRQLINIRDLSLFQRFVRMCAARTGQLLNLSSLAADCGITHNTAASWISVLEASYIIHLLRPHYKNFNKRLVKMPKLYFLDTGLAAWMLGIREKEQMLFHAQRGALFETMIVSECLKARYNTGMTSNLYFWRDSKGLEIDLIIEDGSVLTPVEIKSGKTIAQDFMDGLKKWSGLSGNSEIPSMLIYGGDKEFVFGPTRITPWNRLNGL